MQSFFCCPLCGETLEAGEKTCHCENGHSFDRAAQGYLNLLPVHQKHSKAPGDDREMVAARRGFLETGLYSLFSDALNKLVLNCVKDKSGAAVLDAGCGEGWYTARLLAFLEENGAPVHAAGFDISKPAVKAAAGRCKKAEFAVASAFHIPVTQGAADCLVNVFAPIVPDEYTRVTAPGGHVLLAVPSPRHLWGLKQLLYDEPYENESRDTSYPGFCFLSRTPVRGTLKLDSSKQIQDLFVMTPYYWKTSGVGAARLKKTESLVTDIGFDFLLYERER